MKKAIMGSFRLTTPVITTLILILLSISGRAATNQFSVTASSTLNYTINGVNDPIDIVLVRGYTYTFNISVSSIHPFYIKTAPVTGSGSEYSDGVSAQGVTSGTVTFDVPLTAPGTLFYQCGVHANMTGPLTIVDAPAILITDLSIDSNTVIESTGTEALNLNIQSRSSLTNAWADTPVLSNIHVAGTNTTQVSTPSGNAAFFRVRQGFF